MCLFWGENWSGSSYECSKWNSSPHCHMADQSRIPESFVMFPYCLVLIGRELRLNYFLHTVWGKMKHCYKSKITGMLAFAFCSCGKYIPLGELVSKSCDFPGLDNRVSGTCPGNPSPSYKSLVIGRSFPVFFDHLLSQLGNISPIIK